MCGMGCYMTGQHESSSNKRSGVCLKQELVFNDWPTGWPFDAMLQKFCCHSNRSLSPAGCVLGSLGCDLPYLVYLSFRLEDIQHHHFAPCVYVWCMGRLPSVSSQTDLWYVSQPPQAWCCSLGKAIALFIWQTLYTWEDFTSIFRDVQWLCWRIGRWFKMIMAEYVTDRIFLDSDDVTWSRVL